MRRRTGPGVVEFIDSRLTSEARAAELDDIDRLNAWFRGYAITLRAISSIAERDHQPAVLTVTDVGGGRGDFAVRLVRWAHRRGWRVQVVVVDTAADLPRIARRADGVHPEILLVRADARHLPFRDGAFDLVTASLLLHHFEPPEVVAALAEMRRAAHRALVINDLWRSRLAWMLVWLATRLVAHTAAARHDGPLSVRRAYAPAELAALAEQAGIATLTVRAYPLWARLVAVTG